MRRIYSISLSSRIFRSRLTSTSLFDHKSRSEVNRREKRRGKFNVQLNLIHIVVAAMAMMMFTRGTNILLFSLASVVLANEWTENERFISHYDENLWNIAVFMLQWIIDLPFLTFFVILFVKWGNELLEKVHRSPLQSHFVLGSPVISLWSMHAENCRFASRFPLHLT